MQNTYKRINIGRIRTYLIILLLGLNYLVYAFYNNMELKNNLRIVVIILLTGSLLIKLKFKTYDLFLMFLAVYHLIINGAISYNIVFLVLIMIIFGKQQINDICKGMNSVNFICLVIVILSLALGIVENDKWTFLGRTRNTLGFYNVNNVGTLCYSILSIYLLSLKKINWRNILLIYIFSLYIFFLSDSRTGFYSLIIMMVFWYGLNKIKIIKNLYFVLGIEIMCFISPIIWKIPIINSNKLNSILSLRPIIFSTYIEKNTWVNFLFGGSNVKEVDNFYLVFLFGVGIGIYMIFVLAVLSVTKRLLLNNEYLKVAFVISMLIMGLAESSMIRPEILCVPYFWIMVYRETLKLRSLNGEKNCLSSGNS